MEDFQNERLRKIIKYAYEKIPGYRRKFNEANVKPGDIRTKNDLWKLPITTREELQNNTDFVNEKLISGTLYTGGSTGTSLKYYDCYEGGQIRRDAHLRGWSWNGYVPGKKLCVLSSAQGMIAGKNVLNLIGDLTTENLKINVENLLNFKPQHLRGFVSSLFIFAKYCLENNIRLKSIESINPISENLYDFQREIMETQFNCKVFEEYCCNDGGACAWECDAHEGLHSFMERAIIEDIDGEMIVTDLWNKAMPFVRYRNGDSIRFLNKKCSCGRELPLIKVKGRTNDIIITRQGLLSPSFLIHHGIGLVGADKKKTNFISGIRAVQYIQKPGYILEINIVRNPWCTAKSIADFENTLRGFIKDMEIKINFVEDIPSSKKGKRNFIINEDKELLKKWGYESQLKK
ncbi:MAG: phenylacetate--CoA ligase family protein [Gammaproteobacteria bacterium]|nr:phenylacetate--CoA ligase family protein [Gammaproteobacteria bacterium]